MSTMQSEAVAASAVENEPPAASPQDAAAASYYRQLEPVTAAAHGSLFISDAPRRFDYARSLNLVPLTLRELTPAAQCYPIVFAGETKTPCAVMGLREGENLFIKEDGALSEGAYAPAFLRQYPFLLAKPSADAEQPILFVDRASDQLSDSRGSAMFEDGKPTDITRNVLRFLSGLQREARATEAFSQSLIEHELLDVKELKLVQRSQAEESSAQKPLVTYFAVDMARLEDLPADVLKDLAATGGLRGAYAHSLSLAKWSDLISRAYRQRQMAA